MANNRWPAAHRLDVARLYRLALEKGRAGAAYHAVSDEGVTIREIAEVFAKHLNVPVRSITPEEAPAHFGWISMFAGADMPASSAMTQAELGWKPKEIGLIADIGQPGYFCGLKQGKCDRGYRFKPDLSSPADRMLAGDDRI